MRRRYVRYVPPETDRPILLLMAAGAVAGAAAGLYLGRRYATIGALMDDVKETVRDLREEWNEALEEEEAEAAAPLRGRDDDDDVDARDDEEEYEDEDEDDDGVISEVDDWDDEDEDDELDEDLDDDLDEDLDDDLAEVVASNGHATSQEAAARRLEARVLDALHDDRRLRERAIEIAVVGDGVVELTGAVHAIEEISRAASVVRKVPGVAMVLNRIEVRSAGHVDTASVPREPGEPQPSDEESSSPQG